jgi:phosphoribosylamine-glycine ligase
VKGKLVVGGTPYTDRLEDDRSFGQEELKKEGINIVPYRDFDNFDDAIAYVKANPERYVIKPSGAASNVKRRLFVGDEDDGQDVIRVLEFTARFGYPTISIQQEGMTTPIGQFLADLAAGVNPKLKVKSGFQIGVRVVVSPFPFDDDATFLSVSKHAAILFKKGIPEEVHIEDVMQVNGQWYVAGTSGVVLVVCGVGPTMRQAQGQAYSRIRNIMIPDMYYRDDIGERWFEDHDKLHTWGYLREV